MRAMSDIGDNSWCLVRNEAGNWWKNTGIPAHRTWIDALPDSRIFAYLDDHGNPKTSPTAPNDRDYILLRNSQDKKIHTDEQGQTHLQSGMTFGTIPNMACIHQQIQEGADEFWLVLKGDGEVCYTETRPDGEKDAQHFTQEERARYLVDYCLENGSVVENAPSPVLAAPIDKAA